MPRWVPKMLEVIAWLALVPMLVLCSTQWFQIDSRRTIAVLQALTPFVLAAAVPISIAALATRRYPLALVATIPVVTFAVLAGPIVFPGDVPQVAASAPRFTIGYGNLLAVNPTPESAAGVLAATDADVLVLVEFTPRMRAALDDAVPGDYPHREEMPMGNPSGIGLWSRFPVVSGGVTTIGGRLAIDVVLDVHGQPARVLAVHPPPPTHGTGPWSAQLDAIGDEAAASTVPTVIVGDFNSSRWHPSFRSLLDRGWRDAHEVLGEGWSVSWPMDEGLLPPTFVRIDHALFGDGVAPVSLRDVTVPGSDHKGFLVEFGLTQAA